MVDILDMFGITLSLTSQSQAFHIRRGWRFVLNCFRIPRLARRLMQRVCSFPNRLLFSIEKCVHVVLSVTLTRNT